MADQPKSNYDGKKSGGYSSNRSHGGGKPGGYKGGAGKGGYKGGSGKSGGYKGHGDSKGRPYGKRDGESRDRRDDRRGGSDFKKGYKKPYERDDRRGGKFDGKKREDKFEGRRDDKFNDRKRNDRFDHKRDDKFNDRTRDDKFDRKGKGGNGRDFGKSNRDAKFGDKPRSSSPRGNGKPGFKPQDNKAKRVYKNKKAFDQQKVAAIMGTDAAPYRGELDPKRGERSNIAPGRKTRELREIAQDEERMRDEEVRREREKLDDETLPMEKRFYKNEASPARLAALDVTRAVRKRNAYAHDLIERRIDASDMSQADRAFATLLVLGVVSTSGTLDEIINRGMRKPTDAFDDVRDALRISTYEIIFLGKTPHAALDQGVELVRAVSPSASGLGNAILHRILEMKDSFPFGDPNHDIEALARVYAFPVWLARKLVEDLGAKEAALFMRASNDPAPLFISVNSLKATDAEVARVFEAAGATLRPALIDEKEIVGCYHVSDPRAIAEESVRALFDEGKILVSDAAAQAVAGALFDNATPSTVLEVGAGRGTKTVLIQGDAQRIMGHQVELTSLDLHEFKVKLLEKRAADYDVQLKRVVCGNATRLDTVLPYETYQTVFIDAPCSGLGTLRRHPEIRWRVKPAHIQELADTGLAMLRSAASHVEMGGQLVYATCTVAYAENYGVVKRFLEETEEGKDFRLAPIDGKPCFSSQLTVGSPDAHFAVKFIKVK